MSLSGEKQNKKLILTKKIVKIIATIQKIVKQSKRCKETENEGEAVTKRDKFVSMLLFMSTDIIQSIRDGECRTPTSTFTEL